MRSITADRWRELYKKLPQDLQDAIFSVDVTNSIEEIGKKYNLLIDKMGLLADETGMVMLGETHPRDYISNLSQKLGIDKETARKIAEDINQQIFQKVRESLRKIHEITEEVPIPKKQETIPQVSQIPKPPLQPTQPSPPKQPPIVSQPPKKEIPREELRPLEIRPIKSFAEEIKKETKPIEPAKPIPAAKVMPAGPPPDLPFLDEKKEKTIRPEAPEQKSEPTLPPKKFDPYREPMK